MAFRLGSLHPDEERARVRLGVALVASALTHLVLIHAVGIDPRPPARVVHSRIEARLVGGRLEPVTPPAATEAPVTEGPLAAAPVPAPPDPAPTPGPDVPVPPLADPTYCPSKELTVRPQPLHGIFPVYPPQAARLNLQGRVVLALKIEETGAVSDVTVVTALPEGYFEQSAIDAFRSARFSPPMKDGRAVKSRMMIEVTYDGEPEPPAPDP